MIMTPTHPRWEEFCDRLEGPDGCNFHEDADGVTRWTCGGGEDQSIAIRCLQVMGFDRASIDASCAYFRDHGGYCSCEILFNVNVRHKADGH